MSGPKTAGAGTPAPAPAAGGHDGGMEKVFWALLERSGPRLPHDAFTARDLHDLIAEGRIGDAYIIALQHDRREAWLKLARAVMGEVDGLEGVLDQHGCLPARPAGGSEGEGNGS